MDLMMRRRALMKSSKELYAVTAKQSPLLMAQLFALGASASPDYLTIEEAAVVTVKQITSAINKLPWYYGNQEDRKQDFHGFVYCTSVTQVPIGFGIRFSHIVLHDKITLIAGQGLQDAGGVITIPASVRTVGYVAFSAPVCDFVLDGESVQPWFDQASTGRAGGIYKARHIVVPDNLYQAYIDSMVDGDYTDIVIGKLITMTDYKKLT